MAIRKLRTRDVIIFVICLLIQGNLTANAREAKTRHVYVALCDNVNQGIVKVPAKIGNGQDPYNNLYWGSQ